MIGNEINERYGQSQHARQHQRKLDLSVVEGGVSDGWRALASSKPPLLQ
jgi:hypothetical protein